MGYLLNRKVCPMAHVMDDTWKASVKVDLKAPLLDKQKMAAKWVCEKVHLKV